jgi:hypothetical protein
LRSDPLPGALRGQRLLRSHRGSHAGALGAAVCAVVLSAAPAAAQINAPIQPAPPPGTTVDNPYRVFGDDAPVFAALGVLGALGLSTRVTAEAEYSDNVARQADGEELSTSFQSREDWIFRPSVALRAQREVGRQQLFATGSIGRIIYSRNSFLNSNNFAVGGGAGLSIGSRCGGQLRFGYSNRGAQRADFEEVEYTQREQTTFISSLTCSTSTGISGTVSYDRNRSSNSSNSQSTTDRSFADVRSQSVGGSLGYQLGSRGQVGVQTRLSWSEYPNQPLITGGINSTEVRTLGIYGSYRVGTSIRATASYGITKVNPNAPGTQDFSGSTWNLGASYSVNRLGANLNFGRGVNASQGGSSNYSVSTNLRASATYRLNDRISTAAGFSRTDSDFRGFDQVPETEAIRNSKTDRVFIGADYRLRRIFSFYTDLSHQKRTSSPANFNYNENSITLGLRANF